MGRRVDQLKSEIARLCWWHCWRHSWRHCSGTIHKAAAFHSNAAIGAFAWAPSAMIVIHWAVVAWQIAVSEFWCTVCSGVASGMLVWASSTMTVIH